MEMICIKSCVLFFIVFGLFYLTEGKACPEKVRPHKTRCEMYYKCMELSTQRHVWIPEKCEKGLVFENDLKMCVLPGDDWECLLGEQSIEVSGNKNNFKQQTPETLNKESDIYIVSNGNEDSKFSTDDGTVEVILHSDISSEEENDDEKNLIESSGDGADLGDSFLNAANRETSDAMPDEKMGELSFSSSTPSSTSVDPNLTAHLQRLSQLIDGLKQTYQNRDKEQSELGPDQLNAFLAHFNIRNKFDSINTEEMHGNYKQTELHTTPMTFVSNIFSNVSDPTKETFDTQTNQTLPQESLFLNKLQPETKVVLSSTVPKRYSSTGFSNSQIVVNRPEGSVLFSLPPYSSGGHFVEHTNTHSVQQYEQNVPKISEETLKTVLELSKQMIANQNIPNVIPNPAYYAQPIIQPLFLPPYAPRPSSINSPFSSFYENTNMANADYEDHNNGYGKPSMLGYHKPHFTNKKPQKQSGTTIIHNNVIPVHVTSTNSGEKEVVDSYGQSLGLYPPLADANNNKNTYTFQVTHQYENNKFVTTVRPFVSTTSAGQHSSAQYPPPYSPDYSATTVRPPLQFQPTPATIAEFYTPSPHLNENNVNSLFGAPERYPSQQYGNLPRPLDPNRPDVTSSQYQQLERPSSYQNVNSPFPPQIDPNKVKIRPNSQKVESMETDDDANLNNPSAFSGYGGTNNFDKKPQINAHLYDQSAAFINQATPLSGYPSNTYQNPYMPRPTQNNYGNNFGLGMQKPKFPNYSDGSQLVNIGGNFISYDAFQNNILPLIGQVGSSSSTNIEVISCQTGVRQPNTTDCTRYYVCSKKDGKVLSYSCPPYTAFNVQTRICDARSYAKCSPNAIINSYTVSENKRIEMEAIQALNEAKRRQDEALKTQKLANLLQQYNSHLSAQPSYPLQNVANEFDSTSNNNMLNTYVQQAAMSAMSASTTTPKPPKKRKYYCKEGDKVPDQTSIYNYFVCYKNEEGTMKGKKMTCLKGLLFCPATTSCTLPSRCT